MIWSGYGYLTIKVLTIQVLLVDTKQGARANIAYAIYAATFGMTFLALILMTGQYLLSLSNEVQNSWKKSRIRSIRKKDRRE